MLAVIKHMALFDKLIVLGMISMIILRLIGRWKIFEHFGEKGWKALIPIYNEYIYGRIADHPTIGAVSAFFYSASMLGGITILSIGAMEVFYMSPTAITIPDWLPPEDALIRTGGTILILLTLSFLVWILSRFFARLKLLEKGNVWIVLSVAYVSMPTFVEPILGIFLWNKKKVSQ